VKTPKDVAALLYQQGGWFAHLDDEAIEYDPIGIKKTTWMLSLAADMLRHSMKMSYRQGADYLEWALFDAQVIKELVDIYYPHHRMELRVLSFHIDEGRELLPRLRENQ